MLSRDDSLLKFFEIRFSSILTITSFCCWYLTFLTRARLLNDNQLEGQVPEQIYSVGVHGGAIEYVNFFLLCFISFALYISLTPNSF